MDRHRIWDHVQTTCVDFFEPARRRDSAMATQALRQKGRCPSRVLNLGMGVGDVERLLQTAGWQVASPDLSRETVEAQQRLGLDMHCGHAQGMPFGDDSFDVVVASAVLEHIEPAARAQALRRISRVLAAGGWFVGSVPHCEVLADNDVVCPDCGKVFLRWGHVSRFDRAALQGELAQVFDMVSCQRRSFVVWAAARTPMRLLKALVLSLLGRMGEAIASPSIAFAARRRAGV